MGGAREDRLLPRALTVFGGCAARAAQALGVSGEDLRRRAAALSLACSTGDEGKWCCRRCAPHDRPPREEDAPPPPKRRKKGAGAKVTDIKKTKHPKPHPDLSLIHI